MQIMMLLSLANMISRAADERKKEVLKTPLPDWVQPIKPDLEKAVDVSETSDGLGHLLLDSQVHAGKGATYRHFAWKLLTAGAVDANSRISLSFDPQFESLAIHQLLVYRDGLPINRLPNQVIEILHREASLDRQIYDGRLSAVMILPDIRVGDVVEYAYSVTGENPIFKHRFLDSFLTQWSVPVRRFHQRLLWPKERELHTKNFGSALEPERKERGHETEYVWNLTDSAARASDGNLPSWFDVWSWVHLSEFATWKEVAAWACDLCGDPGEIPPELALKIDECRKQSSPEEQALAALRYVQDDLRYLGIEVGVNSHRPYPVATVLSRRFGDCKDKAILLCTMLRQLGFDAAPALVDTDYRGVIDTLLPSPLDFDHMIVLLRLGDRDYWLDATQSGQGGSLGDLFTPAYGKALVVRKDTTSLTDVMPSGFSTSNAKVTESYEIPDYKGTALLKVHSVFHGSAADDQRDFRAAYSTDQIEKKFLNYYARTYSSIRVLAPPKYQDDRGRNELTCDEEYEISHFWEPHSDTKDRLYGEFHASILESHLFRPATRIRTMPFAISYPQDITEVVQIAFPGRFRTETVNKGAGTKEFNVTYHKSGDDRRVTLEYTFRTFTNHVAAENTQDYCDKIDKARDFLNYEVWIDSKLATDAPSSSTTAETPKAKVDGGAAGRLLSYGFLGIGGVASFVFCWRRRRSGARQRGQLENNALHCCVICGQTEHSEPDTDFRVARDGSEYCRRHLPVRGS